MFVKSSLATRGVCFHPAIVVGVFSKSFGYVGLSALANIGSAQVRQKGCVCYNLLWARFFLEAFVCWHVCKAFSEWGGFCSSSDTFCIHLKEKRRKICLLLSSFRCVQRAIGAGCKRFTRRIELLCTCVSACGATRQKLVHNTKSNSKSAPQRSADVHVFCIVSQ